MNYRNWTINALTVCCLCAAAACTSTPTQESTGEYIDDVMITSKVLAKLAASTETRVTAINVETFKGVVQLSGFVPTAQEAVAAGEIAASVRGVKRIENKLTVISTAEPAAAVDAQRIGYRVLTADSRVQSVWL